MFLDHTLRRDRTKLTIACSEITMPHEKPHMTPSILHAVPLIKPDLPSLDEVADSFREILANGKITNFGKYNTCFEEEASRYLGGNTATTSSGTMGMILVM